MKSNEPAFPVQDAASWQAHGMTLRDYFAAKALHALIIRGDDPSSNDPRDTFSECAYKFADAMILERSKP